MKTILTIVLFLSLNAFAATNASVPTFGQFKNNPLNIQIMLNADSNCDDFRLYMAADMSNLSKAAGWAQTNMQMATADPRAAIYNPEKLPVLGLSQLEAALDMISAKAVECNK